MCPIFTIHCPASPYSPLKKANGHSHIETAEHLIISAPLSCDHRLHRDSSQSPVQLTFKREVLRENSWK